MSFNSSNDMCSKSFLKIITLMIMTLISYSGLAADSKTVASNPKLSNKTTQELTEAEPETITIVPRIRITDNNTMQSYAWWEKDKFKIPNVYKEFLKKIKDDFALEKYQIKYEVQILTKENMKDHEGLYVLFGNMIYDSKDKKNLTVTDLSLYKIQNGNMDLLVIPNVAFYNLQSSFRPYALNLKEKLKLTPTLQTESTNPMTQYFVVFENELNYEELNQIKESMKQTLGLKSEDIQLLYSETGKYTFQLKINRNPAALLKDVIFVNGPYQSAVNDHTIVFKPMAEDTEKTAEDEIL